MCSARGAKRRFVQRTSRGVFEVDDVEEFVLFVGLRERLCMGLEQMARLQKLQLEVLKDVQKSSAGLSRMQERHKSWKVGEDVRVLAASVGMKSLFARTTSDNWPRYGWLR
jgi:hypothetical protein